MTRPGGKDHGIFFRPNPRGSQLAVYRGEKIRGDWWCWWVCSKGHTHREKCGPKDVAKALHARRRQQVQLEGFCLADERGRLKRQAQSRFRDVKDRYVE